MLAIVLCQVIIYNQVSVVELVELPCDPTLLCYNFSILSYVFEYKKADN
jgi:hypothetical protein